MKSGFVPALGTPLDKDGCLVADSLKKHIDDQINAGAVGLLCMGSMGQEAFIRDDVYPEVAKVAVEAVKGRVPLFIGAMDTSVARVKRRIAALEELDIDGLVFTMPFYAVPNRQQTINFFRGVAALTKHKILLYDLPPVTQARITYDMVLELIETVPNLAGIKSADTVMFRKLKLNPNVPKDFIMVYSGLDMCDIAYKWGLDNCLDGMFACTPYNSGKMVEAMEAGDYVTAAACLDNITGLRDCFLANDLMPSFTAAMNMLGYDGDFSQDYNSPVTETAIANVKAELIRIGELKG
ncbi:MAG: dihydrodipicolinate synthase family protein [Clostridia bacterium]|nr:dihydrodipicolinate synthase family protein [Clostridia bacterium]